MKHKIHLNNAGVKSLSSTGQRKHAIKKNKRPYERHDIKRDKKGGKQNTYLRRVVYQSGVSLIIIVCVLVMSSIDYKIFNDAQRGIDFLVNHEFSFSQVFTVFNLKDDNAIPTVSEESISFANPTTGEVISDLLDDDGTIVGVIYSVPDGQCYCSCDGTVFYVDTVSVSNPYIRIRHDDGYDTLYMGIIADVAVGDNVSRGQVIGSSVGNNMGFVLLKNSKHTDITPFMDTSP